MAMSVIGETSPLPSANNRGNNSRVRPSGNDHLVAPSEIAGVTHPPDASIHIAVLTGLRGRNRDREFENDSLLLGEAAEEAVGLPLRAMVGVGDPQCQLFQDGVELCGGRKVDGLAQSSEGAW